MLDFASDVTRSATAILVALPVRRLNAFSICDSENDFHKQPMKRTDPL